MGMIYMCAHKNYRGNATYSCEDGVFHGKLLGFGALVNYESETGGLADSFRGGSRRLPRAV